MDFGSHKSLLNPLPPVANIINFGILREPVAKFIKKHFKTGEFNSDHEN